MAGEESMYDMVHQMRTRMITSPSFTGDKIIGAILFENTMDREIEGMPTGQFLWEKKGIVPFIKCDKGLAAEENGVQLMKPMPDLDILLKKSVEKNMFGKLEEKAERIERDLLSTQFPLLTHRHFICLFTN